MRYDPGVWPKGQQPGPDCPRHEEGDAVKFQDTKNCPIESAFAGLCPCRAVLGGWDDEWRGYNNDGNALPQHGENA